MPADNVRWEKKEGRAERGRREGGTLVGGRTRRSLPGAKAASPAACGRQVPFSWVGHLTEFARLVYIKVGFTKHMLGLDDLTALTL